MFDETKTYQITKDNAYLQDGDLLFYKGKLAEGKCLIVTEEWKYKAVIKKVIHSEFFDIGVVEFLAISQDGITFQTIWRG